MIKSSIRNILSSLVTMLCMLCTVGGISVSADATIVDDCALLSQEEIDTLQGYLYETGETLSIDVAVVVTDQTDRMDAMDFADRYEENLFGVNSNSILYLINMNDGYDWISTSGTAIRYYPDSTIDYILQSTSGTYLTSDSMNLYMAIKQFNALLISEQKRPLGKGTVVVASMVIALIISIITCSVIASQYRFHATTSAEIYAKTNDGNVEFTRREDRFIRTVTSKTPKPNDSTSTHVSSGGGTHGGGGFQR